MSKDNDAPEQPDPNRDKQPGEPEPVSKEDHVITAKDAGWRRRGLFVAPATFVPIDPPRPKNRRKPS